MNAKHTPGPWEAIGNLVRSPMSKEGGNGVALAECADRYFLKVNSDEAKANAYLMAAAPELLEALEELVSEFGVCGLTEKARAVIAKATGEL